MAMTDPFDDIPQVRYGRFGPFGPWPLGEEPTMRILCETCGKGWEIHDYLGVSLINRGVIRKELIEHHDHTQTRFLGTCDDCKRQARGDKVPDPDVDDYRREPLVRHGSEYQIAASVQKRLHELEKAHPSWSRKHCSKQAVEDIYDPRFELNAAYRAYLLGTAPNHVTSVEVAEVRRLLEPAETTVSVFIRRP